LAGSILIYGWAYWHLGFRSMPAMFRRFVVHDEARAFMGVTVGKVLTIPIGMANSVFPIFAYLNFRGLRGLLTLRNLSSTALIVLLIALLLFLMFFVVQAFRTLRQLHPFARLGLLTATIGFAFVFVPLIIWVPTYDKLWIEPLACLAVLVGIALSNIPRAAKKQFLLSRIVSILVLIGPLWNLVLVARHHSQGTPEIESAHRLEEMI